MKTAMQWLENYLNQKVLPCPEGNDYVYGMNVAHENLINYVIPALLEKEKEQIIDAHTQGHNDCYEYHFLKNSANEIAIKEGEEYYNQKYQNK